MTFEQLTLKPLNNGAAPWPWRRVHPYSGRSYFFAFGLIAAATAIGVPWVLMLGAKGLPLVYFASIVGAGVWLGTRPALFAAVLAFASYEFLLIEPRHASHIFTYDIIVQATFLIVALLVGWLAGRLSDHARHSGNRLRDLTLLFEASRDLSGAVDPTDAAQRVVYHLERAGCTAALWVAGPRGMQMAAASESVCLVGDLAGEPAPRFLDPTWVDEIGEHQMALRLETGTRALGGVVIWLQTGKAAVNPDQRWIAALLDLGASAIDRARLIREIAETRVVAKREKLRTALLSSLSHDLRTPISSILASATALKEYEDCFDAATRGELLDTIRDESERLNRYIANLLEMTRLESGELHERRALIDPGEAMAAAVKRLDRKLNNHRLSRKFNTGGLRVDVDPVLFEQALVNVLENAIAHAPEDSTITLRIQPSRKDMLLLIEDEGPGISPDNIERIFHKFFRAQEDRRATPGVGLGLSVTRGLIESFGGSIYAVSPAMNGKGARMVIRLPAHPALEHAE
jgi:K+-sensing histidine kinase KdpD